MDNDGNVVHTWAAGSRPAFSVYLVENGDLLRTGEVQNSTFSGAGTRGGLVERLDANSSVVWSYTLSSNTEHRHHDIEPLPNGNVLMIAWEMITGPEAIAAGRDPSLLADGQLWPDKIVEVDPYTNQVVWEWRAWDHLVQDYDAGKPHYGTVADHPELIDLNFVRTAGSADWLHVNRVDYNAGLDQIMLSVHGFDEIWIIDHATTTAEAAGPAGDLLYRWGNPRTYDAGTAADQVFYGQHDAQWIEAGLPGTGNILVFNNGRGRPEGNYSSIEELIPPVDVNGNYTLDGAAYGPDAVTWNYTADPPTDLYSQNISGTQRLGNGNTLICEGEDGDFIEVNAQGEVVWTYSAGDAVFDVDRYETDDPGVQALLGSDGLLEGKRLVIRDYADPDDYSRRKIIVYAKDAGSIHAPAASPMSTGATVVVQGNGPTLDSQTFNLPSGAYDPETRLGWKELGNPAGSKGYKFIDKDLANSACKLVLLKPGSLLKALCKGSGITYELDEPNQVSIAVKLSIGNDSYCMVFEDNPVGALKVDRSVFEKTSGVGLFRAVDSVAPPDCPVP
jgi:hypothetical protein